jgi:hypothetical protein
MYITENIMSDRTSHHIDFVKHVAATLNAAPIDIAEPAQVLYSKHGSSQTATSTYHKKTYSTHFGHMGADRVLRVWHPTEQRVVNFPENEVNNRGLLLSRESYDPIKFRDALPFRSNHDSFAHVALNHTALNHAGIPDLPLTHAARVNRDLVDSSDGWMRDTFLHDRHIKNELHEYTRSSRDLNKELISDPQMQRPYWSTERREFIHNIHKIATPVPYALKTYSGFASHDPRDHISKSGEYKNPCFISTSIAPKIAANFIGHHVGQNQHIIRFNLPQGYSHGTYLEHITKIPNENEFLLHPGQRWRATGSRQLKTIKNYVDDHIRAPRIFLHDMEPAE